MIILNTSGVQRTLIRQIVLSLTHCVYGKIMSENAKKEKKAGGTKEYLLVAITLFTNVN